MSNSRQESIDFHRNYCVHYEPRTAATGCALGLNRPHVFNTHTGKKWHPCIEGHLIPDPCSHCPKWERPSIESAEKYADGIEACMRRMLIVDPVIGAWRSKPKPVRDRAEVIKCPACQGRLHLEQSSYNGHVRAQCETPECVSFIE